MKKKKIAITLGIMCLMLTLAIAVQIRSVKGGTQVAVQSKTENDLKDEVFRWKEKYDTTHKLVEESEKELEKVRSEATKNSENDSNAEKQVKENNMLLGLTNVKGSGVVITIKDNSNTKASSVLDPSLLLVHDGDLRSIVNELKNAGAEAIEINGQRIVQTTAIVCDGNVVRINGVKLGSPFVIIAIGLPERFVNVNRVGGYLEMLEDDGVSTEIKKSNDITISKYNGVITNEYMETVR